MKVLENIEPKKVMEYFEILSTIPHGSGNTKAISDYCVEYAKEHGFEYHQDDSNNVIIICPPTTGYENAPAVIIQGHLDMVCEKDANVDFDFTKDALKLMVDGDYVTADGTTLGADDGIAVAMALALMDDTSIPHPKLEAVFTVDEEIGLLGATAIDLSMLEGKMLINIDSEIEGILTVSCAGGSTTKSIIPVNSGKATGNIYKLTIDGLSGGHSGVEIDKNRANANILMGRLLYALCEQSDIKICELEGGMKDNAIPALSSAVIISDTDISAIVKEYDLIFKNEYKTSDSGVRVQAQFLGNYQRNALDKKSTKKVISYLVSVPNGIQRMSAEIEGLVQTSLNLGILKLTPESMNASYSVRSSVGTEKSALNTKITAITEALGGTVEISGEYPAWEYNPNSKLRDIMADVYREMYGKEIKIEAIHAGLECGVFCGKISGLDCVSLGPDLPEIHTPRERMSMSSVQRVWKYLLEVLKRIN